MTARNLVEAEQAVLGAAIAWNKSMERCVECGTNREMDIKIWAPKHEENAQRLMEAVYLYRKFKHPDQAIMAGDVPGKE